MIRVLARLSSSSWFARSAQRLLVLAVTRFRSRITLSYHPESGATLLASFLPRSFPYLISFFRILDPVAFILYKGMCRAFHRVDKHRGLDVLLSPVVLFFQLET